MIDIDNSMEQDWDTLMNEFHEEDRRKAEETGIINLEQGDNIFTLNLTRTRKESSLFGGSRIILDLDGEQRGYCIKVPKSICKSIDRFKNGATLLKVNIHKEGDGLDTKYKVNRIQ